VKARRIAVLGAGVSGLGAALALARDGHHVTLIERDNLAAGRALDSPAWKRPGIPHFLQAHAFTARGRRELKSSFPDMFESLIAAGAHDIDLRRKLPGPSSPGDEDLAILGVRRPLIEWALRKAIAAEDAIDIRSGVRVAGLVAESARRPVVTGVQTSAGPIAADLTIDALGRRSPVQGWIAGLGGEPMAEESSDCGVIYYTRYYKVRDGASLPDGPWIPTPRSDLGYGLFSSFPGDNGTFAGLIAIPPGDTELKILRHRDAFDAATKLMPALHAWTNPDVSTPFTDVLPMGSLQNVLRTEAEDGPPAAGLISIGDAVCHTDPVFALGLSFGLMEARALAAAVREHGTDGAAVGRAFNAAVRPAMAERYRYAAAVDGLRLRLWQGEAIDFAHREGGAYPLFAFMAGSATVLSDADIFRAVIRRNYFLDPLGVLDADVALQQKIESRFAELRATPRPRPGPPRDELIATMRHATALT